MWCLDLLPVSCVPWPLLLMGQHRPPHTTTPILPVYILLVCLNLPGVVCFRGPCFIEPSHCRINIQPWQFVLSIWSSYCMLWCKERPLPFVCLTQTSFHVGLWEEYPGRHPVFDISSARRELGIPRVCGQSAHVCSPRRCSCCTKLWFYLALRSLI